MTVGEFVELLWKEYREHEEALSRAELLRYGHFRGWLEDSDERQSDSDLNRQTAARIIHQFLLLECGVPDLADISPATNLKDLYTCRVCANHIAQVYLRGIMGAQEYGECEEGGNLIIIFNHLEKVSEKEALEIIKNSKKF